MVRYLTRRAFIFLSFIGILFKDSRVMAMTARLSPPEVVERLRSLPDWGQDGDSIQCVKRFKDFVETIRFVNALVEPAEAAGHHPDLSISYNRLTIRLTTHDLGGLTQKDFDLAAQISQLQI